MISICLKIHLLNKIKMVHLDFAEVIVFTFLRIEPLNYLIFRVYNMGKYEIISTFALY